MGFFDAFYFMSYTATTIGFGELPQAFNDAQRMWVTLCIYLTVVGWAYAIGSLLALLRDRSFRQALAVQQARRGVARIREPFWLMAGHGLTGELLGRWLDELGRRFVVVDLLEEHVTVLDLGSYRSEVPALVADARNPQVLTVAGLQHPQCEGVLALTDDDEANLAVTMAATVLRPDLPVIARASSPAIEHRMRVFGAPTVINPFDRFGDHLGLVLRAPAADQLSRWLTSEPGARLPQRLDPLAHGRWVVCGYGRFGREVTRDLRRDGLDVVVIEPSPVPDEPAALQGDGTDPEVLRLAGVDRAVGFVAGTDNDITNLSLVVAARRFNPALAVVARQNQPMNADLFEAMRVDVLMVPTEVVAQEALAHMMTPLLWEFLQELVRRDEDWAAALLDRITTRCGTSSPELWQVSLTPADAPALVGRVSTATVLLGDVLRDPLDRTEQVEAVPLMLTRGDTSTVTPADDTALLVGDTLLLAGRASARRAMESTLLVDAATAYVLTGEQVGSSWVWRRLSSRKRVSRTARGGPS